MKTIRYATTLVVLMLLALPLTARAQSTASALPDLMPRDLEIAFALSAVPEHLRSEATVYALERGGYVTAREGTNGFSCLVRRSGVTPARFHGSYVALCYDAEGSRTLLASDLEQARLFEEGKTHDEVDAIIRQKWAAGDFTAPGPGISYMLSPAMQVKPVGGEARPYIPHLMFYAAYKTGDEIGASTPPNPRGHVPFITEPGQPYSMVIVPTGEKERAAIEAREQALIARMQPYLNR